VLTKPLLQYGFEEAIEAGCDTMAILTGQTLIGDEPFAVILADDLCDNDKDSVLTQMSEHCIVVIEEIPKEFRNKYGDTEVETKIELNLGFAKISRIVKTKKGNN